MKPWIWMVIGAGFFLYGLLKARPDGDYVELTAARRADFAARAQRARLERVW